VYFSGLGQELGPWRAARVLSLQAQAVGGATPGRSPRFYHQAATLLLIRAVPVYCWQAANSAVGHALGVGLWERAPENQLLNDTPTATTT